jgi:hypothetical protein
VQQACLSAVKVGYFAHVDVISLEVWLLMQSEDHDAPEETQGHLEKLTFLVARIG